MFNEVWGLNCFICSDYFKWFKPINNISSPQHGWLWSGELYNDNIQNRFGGKTEEAIENNVWLPCGKAVSLKDASSVTVTWEEGDTYF